MDAPRLHIHRWHNEYFVDRGHPAPGRVRDECDRLVPQLSDALERALAARTDEDGEGVVLIRHLDFACAFDPGIEAGRRAGQWAEGFVRALTAAVDAGDGILRFPSVAAYRARFIADLSRGGAWQSWYYRPFAGLQVLPAAAAIRTLLLEDLQLGRDTLAALPDATWPALGNLLTRIEAQRILSGLAAESGRGDEDVSLLKPLVERSPLAGTGASAPVHALAVLCAGLRAGVAPEGALATWSRLAGGLLELADRADGSSLLAALLDDGAETALPAEGATADTMGAVRRTLAAHPQWRRACTELFLSTTRTSPPALAARLPDPCATEYAGFALLLPEFDALLDARQSRALPSAAPPGPRNLAAWLALAHCAGRDRAAHFVRDPFWRGFFGVDPRTGYREIVGWLQGGAADTALGQLAGCTQLPATPLAGADLARLRSDWRYLHLDWRLPGRWGRFFARLAQIALRRFACRIPGAAASSLQYLHANFLAGRGRSFAGGRLQLERPPLYLLLKLAGLAEGTGQWSGPPLRRLQLEYVQ